MVQKEKRERFFVIGIGWARLAFWLVLLGFALRTSFLSAVRFGSTIDEVLVSIGTGVSYLGIMSVPLALGFCSIVVSQRGVSYRPLFRRRFVPFSEIEHVLLEPRSVKLALKGGAAMYIMEDAIIGARIPMNGRQREKVCACVSTALEASRVHKNP
jgi:hypothetical protein